MHLQDELSYSKVTSGDWYVSHLNVIKCHGQLLTTYSRFTFLNVPKFLHSYDHFGNPAKFNVIPKIHKDPMVGRPIAASPSYITWPISIFVEGMFWCRTIKSFTIKVHSLLLTSLSFSNCS